jgi:hypothetical protein
MPLSPIVALKDLDTNSKDAISWVEGELYLSPLTKITQAHVLIATRIQEAGTYLVI